MADNFHEINATIYSLGILYRRVEVANKDCGFLVSEFTSVQQRMTY